NERGLQPRLALFPDYRSLKFSVDHFAGIAVNEFSKSIPGQSPLSGGIAIQIPNARPRYILRHSAQIIPNQHFPVLRALVPRAAGSIRKEQQKGSANKETSGGHSGLRFSSNQHLLMRSGNIQSCS